MRVDGAERRPGRREHFSCLGSSRTTPGCALNHWWLGKIKPYSPRAKKWNFTIQWGAAEGPERQAAKLENYFRLESGEAAVSGNWVYLKQSRRLSARRGRDDSDDGDDDEGGFGGDDGDSDGDGAAPARALPVRR